MPQDSASTRTLATVNDHDPRLDQVRKCTEPCDNKSGNATGSHQTRLMISTARQNCAVFKWPIACQSQGFSSTPVPKSVRFFEELNLWTSSEGNIWASRGYRIIHSYIWFYEWIHKSWTLARIYFAVHYCRSQLPTFCHIMVDFWSILATNV